ncbi:hypothetical protein AVEN_250489-1 [Araneus ventricosus]|uniref:Uncharacterized protein n=1 Tax=Araneus ventricosus TaxID=182803 RepID=A0A4Y2QWG1_ARAVE|nr:hypothetical protein AVEN_250489-1 [Araneus ventricosus]
MRGQLKAVGFFWRGSGSEILGDMRLRLGIRYHLPTHSHFRAYGKGYSREQDGGPGLGELYYVLKPSENLTSLQNKPTASDRPSSLLRLKTHGNGLWWARIIGSPTVLISEAI